MRLFVAVWPPPGAVDELTRALVEVRTAEIGTGVPPLRWTSPQQWHLTLAFLGEVADDRRPELERRLARAAARHQPVALRLAGAGQFGNRVLFVKLSGDLAAMKRLAASASAAARRAGIPVPDRPYRPHLTLARAGTTSPGELRLLAARLAAFESSPWTAAGFDLVQSQLGRGPGRRAEYRTVASWPLRQLRPSGQARVRPQNS
jgi:RNA 2',3'-cyclic 3'-phosphodiesterase